MDVSSNFIQFDIIMQQAYTKSDLTDLIIPQRQHH